MTDLLELQTGQVSFLSGLLAGFSLTIAANIVQLDMRRVMPRVCLLLMMLSGLLFLIALYVDVRLTIELAGITELSAEASGRLSAVRLIGTSCATAAYLVFVVAVGSLGWIAGRGFGIFSSLLTLATLVALGYVWFQIGSIPVLSAG